MTAMSAEASAAAVLIDLAREPAFQLGGAEVRPATLEMLRGDLHQLVEPRVMQVLVALARRRGEIVSRDDLVQSCWGGRIVGEDAINRGISQVRRLAERFGGFKIDTVRGVGVRLLETDTDPSSVLRRVPRPVLLVAAAIVLLLGGAAAWTWRHSLVVVRPADPRIAVRAFDVIGGDPAARAFAAALTDEVSGFLGEHAVGYAVQGAADGSPDSADIILHGAVVQEAGAWRVRAYLVDRRSRITLWSEAFERPVAEADALRDEVAASLTNMTYWAMLPRVQEGLTLDPQTLALFISASRAFSNPRGTIDDPRILRLYEQVAARAPNFAWARGAISRHVLDASRAAPPEQREALKRRAREEAERAIRIDRSDAIFAFDTLYQLTRWDSPGALVAAEDVLLKGVAASGERGWPLRMRECGFLLEVGRAADALSYCASARALRPVDAVIDGLYARALLANGQVAQAREMADQVARFHAAHPGNVGLRAEFAAFQEDPERARELFRRLSGPLGMAPEAVQAGELYFTARRTGDPADIDKAMAAGWMALRAGRIDRRTHALRAATLGRLDDAYRVLDEYRTPPSPTGYLLEPAAAPLRRDPRFWSVAVRAGYVRYWRTRDKWPDFCRDPALLFDCRRAAAGVAG